MKYRTKIGPFTLQNDTLLSHGSGPYWGLTIELPGHRPSVVYRKIKLSWGGYGWIHGPGGCWNWIPAVEWRAYGYIYRVNWLAGSIGFILR